MRFGISDDDSLTSAIELNVKVGDVIVIPAGVAHCALKDSGSFSMVGSYPEVSSFLYSRPDDRVLHHGTCVTAVIPMSVRIRKR